MNKCDCCSDRINPGSVLRVRIKFVSKIWNDILNLFGQSGCFFCNFPDFLLGIGAPCDYRSWYPVNSTLCRKHYNEYRMKMSQGCIKMVSDEELKEEGLKNE